MLREHLCQNNVPFLMSADRETHGNFDDLPARRGDYIDGNFSSNAININPGMQVVDYCPHTDPLMCLRACPFRKISYLPCNQQFFQVRDFHNTISLNRYLALAEFHACTGCYVTGKLRGKDLGGDYSLMPKMMSSLRLLHLVLAT